MKHILDTIKSRSKELMNEVSLIRRHLHAHPELSFQEFKTSAYVCEKLQEYGVEYTSGWVKTGIVALVKGKNPDKKVIALRSDLDALPIVEENKVSYCSTNMGVMHACGHDVHTACLLGVAKMLNELKGEFEGTVKFIFQPGEEKLPGGASLMIQEGVLENPHPTAIFGQHVTPQLEQGQVGFRPGMYMASADELYLTVTGKGGHAALPAHYNNPILIASKILLALQEEFMTDKLRINQHLGPEKAVIPTVLAFGKINAAGATNVIPEKVFLEGTFRTFDETWRADAHKRMKEIATNIAKEMNGGCDFRIELGYPFLVNDTALTERSKAAAIEFLGKENVIDLELRMTSEDFAFYSQLAPACFYRLGTGNKSKNIVANVHTATFDIDEAALETGVGLLCWMAIQELSITS